MKKLLLLICLFTSTMNVLVVKAQPPGKLMCGPVTFTAIEQNDRTTQVITRMSFYEDGNSSGYIYIEHEDGNSEVIPLEKKVNIYKSNHTGEKDIYLYADCNKIKDLSQWQLRMTTSDLVVPCSPPSIGLLTMSSDGRFKRFTYYLYEYTENGGRLPYLSKRTQYVEQYDKLVDYMYNLMNKQRSGFFKPGKVQKY